MLFHNMAFLYYRHSSTKHEVFCFVALLFLPKMKFDFIVGYFFRVLFTRNIRSSIFFVAGILVIFVDVPT